MAEEQPRYSVSAEELDRFSELGRELSTLVMLRHARIAEQMGLSVTDHKALDLAARVDGPLTAGRMAQLTGLSTGAVTGMIDRLERAGFVRRVRDTKDRRRVLIEILPVDAEKYAPLFASTVAIIEKVLAGFSRPERALIERFQRDFVALLRADILP